MDTPHFSLTDISDFLQNELAVKHYPDDEKGGIYYPSERPVRQLGLALEPFSKLSDWVKEAHLDALWLHRPWQLDLAQLPSDVGVVAHHLPFDETLTIGYNSRLAKHLDAKNTPEPLGYKEAVDSEGKALPPRPIGMLVDVAEQEFDQWLDTIKTLFGGYDRAEAGHGPGGWQTNSHRIAVVGAMTDTLIREAAERGAQMYLTGAYRKQAQHVADETGIAVVSVGHRRTEELGLRLLADVLSERFAINCLIHK